MPDLQHSCRRRPQGRLRPLDRLNAARPLTIPCPERSILSSIAFALVLTGVLLNAAAQLLLKAGTNAVGHFEFHLDNVVPIGLKLALEPHILSGMVCYAISLVVWIMALSRAPVSIAYPMLSIGYVISAFIAWHWFGEPLSSQKLLGTGFICLGVWLVARS